MPKKQSINWKAIIWIIIIGILLLLIVNMISNVKSGGNGFKTSSSRDDKWWGTSHEKTEWSLSGKKTSSHSCPFWNRDC